MKNKLLIICMIVMCRGNLEASHLPEIIMQSPIASAVTGYVIGNVGHQVISGCNLNPFVEYTKTSVEKEFDLVGLQFMGVSMYVYRDFLKRPCEPTREGCSGKIYDIARFTREEVSEIHGCYGCITHAEKDVYVDGDEEELGAAILFDFKSIESGLISAVICGSVAWLVAP